MSIWWGDERCVDPVVHGRILVRPQLGKDGEGCELDEVALTEAVTVSAAAGTDPEALARAIDRILSDGDLARRLSEGAHERGKDYDWGVLAEHV